MEINFDGLVGPTHNFGGLSPGNTASTSNIGKPSFPKKAALQGLKKMSLLKSLGILQGFIPPQQRPDLETLKKLGYTRESAPLETLLLVSSASSMWAANSVNITPSCDTEDGKVHLTPANLIHSFHRSIELPKTVDILKKIFPSFTHHAPLPAHSLFGDEGAANHVRLASSHDQPGIHLFVYGSKESKRYQARQSKFASMAIARTHGILERSLFLEQSPEAIDAGVFHNDVISFGNEHVFVVHEKAFSNGQKDIDAIAEFYQKKCQKELLIFKVTEKEFPLDQAVSTYFFNSQLVTLPKGKMVLIAPKQCENLPIIHSFRSEIPVEEIYFIDLSESMSNGGGPACLKFSIQLTEEELKNVNPDFLLSNQTEKKLQETIEKKYPETLQWEDLRNRHFNSEFHLS